MATHLHRLAVAAALLAALPAAAAAQDDAAASAPAGAAVNEPAAPAAPAPAPATSLAGTGAVAGVAVDVATGEPLVGALVQLTGPALPEPRTVLSGDAGRISVGDLPPGTYAVAVTLDGYQRYERPALEVKAGETARFGAWLTRTGTDVQEVVVTGSRIRHKDVATAAPVTVIDEKQLRESGVVGLGEFLQLLPTQGNSLNAQRNNGNDGELHVDLRSLESKRTLVLVNGRRWIAGGPGGTGGVADMNTIPLAAVDHIEILKDGASAIYGSDAIAGVVNVILKKKFEGTELSAQGGTSSRGDAESWDVSGSTGLTTERGSMFFSFGWQEQRPLFANARGFSRVPQGYSYKTGSSAPSPNTLTGNGQIIIPGIGDICAGDPAGLTAAMRQACQAYAASGQNDFTYDPATHSYRARNPATDTYDIQPWNYLLTPARRLQLFSTGNTALGKEVRGFYEASFTHRTSKTSAAPQPVFATVSKDSAYNPFGEDLFTIRRMVEFGPRAYTQEQNTFRVVGGVEGELGAWARALAGWKWDVSYNYGRNGWIDTRAGVLRQSQLDAATGAGCGTVEAPAAGCVPFDVLHGVGTASQAQLAQLGFVGIAQGVNEMHVLSANANGAIFTLWANRPAALAAGADWRRESGSYTPDPVTVAGDSTDGNQLPVSGAYTAREAYGELSIPIVSQRPGLEDLELSLAARRVDYSSFGADTSYKLGARWMPVRDVTLRGTFSTAFRAPNIDELYAGTTEGYEDATDPCGAPTDPAIARQCGTASGDTSGQVKSLSGGNTRLQPETAKTFTAGVVLEPRWVRHLALTLDYWDIRIDDTVDTLRTHNILAGCYTGDPATVSAADCGRIHRNKDTGIIDYVDDRFTNIGGTRTSGLDLGARWLLPVRTVGDFRFDLDATWLARYDRTTADGTVHAAGTYDLQFILPRWKWNARVGWQRGPFTATTETRYIGQFKECGNVNGESIGGSCAANPEYARRVSANLVLDLAAGYDLKSSLGTTSLLVGVRNVFDSAPPLVFNGADNNSDPAYDYVGRYVWARVTQRF